MFQKFISIENFFNYQDKYVVTEKIDGSNIQFIFYKGNMRIASRNTIVDENFSNCKSVIVREQFVNLFDRLKRMSNEVIINLYGEIYSNNIQKNIKYGKDTNIKFFSIMLDGKYQSFKKLQEIIDDEELIVPIVCFCDTIEEMKNFDIENFKSIVANNGEIAEGVIIQPYLYWNENRVIKLKSEKFKEVNKKEKIAPTADVLKAREVFKDYLTDNRMKNIISHNDISNLDMKQKAQIVVEFIKDAQKDFEEEQDLSSFGKENLKTIYKFDFSKEIERLNNLLK